MNIGSENEYIEFKRSTSGLKEGIQSIATMLNKHGKGTLYFGVKNNGEVIGQQIGETTLNQLSRDIAINIKPSFVYDVEEKYTPDGKCFIEVTFHGSKTPFSAYNRYFLRFHDEDRVMDNDMLREYYRQSNNDYSYWEKSNSNVGTDALDIDLLKKYYENCFQKGRISYRFEDCQKFLSRLGLMYDYQYLNNAGNVLFSKNTPVRLKLVTFASETRLTILDIEVFEGNVFECINKALDYISRGIMWKAEFDGSVQRKEIPEIPLEAVREIVVNAFSHGEYDSNTDFEIAIYKNRVSIYSPGHFPKPYSPEEFATGYIEPIPMNDTITQVLYKNGTIEQMSTGFERTFELCEKKNVKYSYLETSNGFRFEFFRSNNIPEELSKTERKVLEVIIKDNHIKVDDIASKCNVSLRTVARAISKLKSLGFLKRIGSDKDGCWEVL